MQQSNKEGTKFHNKHAKDKQEEELYFGNDADCIAELSKLKLENEKYQQEVYGLRRTLTVTKTMVRDLQQENEIIEQRHDLALQEKDAALLDADTKYRVAQEYYTQHIALLEAKLNQETEEKEQFQNLLQQQNKQKRNVQTARNLEFFSESQPSFELLFCYIIIIFILFFFLQEEKEKRKQAEGLINQLKNECKEYQRVMMVNKEQLAEKTEALEIVRGQLHFEQSKMLSVKQSPSNDSIKGNSLFCEVEDRRLDAMSKIHTLQKKYEEMKNLHNARAIEMKALKIEHTEMLRKWKNNIVVTHRADFELICKYKNRIEDLENKLKTERQREMDLQKDTSSNISCNHAEFVINELKRERQELRLNLEDLSTQLLILEEAKFNLNNLVRHWQHKSTVLELQLRTLKTELECKFTYTNRHASPEAVNENSEPDLITERAEISEVPNKISDPFSSSYTQQFLDSSQNSPDARQIVPMTKILFHDEKSEEPIKSTKGVTMDNHSAYHPHELESKKGIRSTNNATNEMEKKKAKKQGKNREYPVVLIDC